MSIPYEEQQPKKVDKLLLRMGTACLVTMLAVATVFMNQAVFSDLAVSFSLAVQDARFSFSVISLCYALAYFFVGPFVDSFNPRTVATMGLVLLSLLLGWASLVHDYSLFLVSMGMTGVAAAIVPAAMIPYVTFLAPAKKLGAYIGAVVASATLGIIVGRVSLGVLTDVVGWRTAYGVFAVVFACLAAWTFRLLEGGAGRGMETGLAKQYGNMLRLLVRPATALVFFTGFCLFFGFLGAVTFLTYRLTGPAFGFTSGQVGYISFAGFIAIVAPFAGGLAQRVGVYRVVLPGLLICLAGLQCMGWSLSVPFVALGIFLVFLGTYSCQPLLLFLISRLIPRESMGSASSLYILFCIGGGSVASIVLGGVWDGYGWPGIVRACTASVTLALVIAGVMWAREKGK